MTKQNGMDNFSLQGETALITGGGSGIGLGIAECFVKSGAKVVLVGRRQSVLQESAEQLGPNAFWVAHDILQLDSAAELISAAAEVADSPISALINNAGTHLKKWAIETTPHEFSAVLQTHLVAAQALTQAALPEMLERKHGNILFTASMTSFMGMTKVIAYSAAKSAYLGMVRALTAEVAGSGVRVNAVAPGWIESPMLHEALCSDSNRKNRILQRTPMACFGKPDDVGWAAVYLCSPAAKFISGVVLPVDGGASSSF